MFSIPKGTIGNRWLGGAMKSLTPILLTVFCSCVYADNSENKENVAEVLRRGTTAVPLNADAPPYPKAALRRGIEGWVVVGFNITADGTTDEIEIRESSIDDYFDDAAIEATRTKTYKPATRSGKPVIQGNQTVKFTFQITNSNGGVSRQFRGIYRQASAALGSRELELAKDLIDKLDGKEKRLLAEVCYLDILKANYFHQTGDDKASLRHIRRALVTADETMPKEIYISLLRQAIVEYAKANELYTSLRFYKTLLEVDKKLAADDPIHNFAAQVRKVLNGDSNIAMQGETSQSCSSCGSPDEYIWWHELNRKRFLIDQVVGQLNKIVISCENSFVSIVYHPDTAWTVNKDGGECSIRVFGNEGTTFRLVELANES